MGAAALKSTAVKLERQTKPVWARRRRASSTPLQPPAGPKDDRDIKKVAIVTTRARDHERRDSLGMFSEAHTRVYVLPRCCYQQVALRRLYSHATSTLA